MWFLLLTWLFYGCFVLFLYHNKLVYSLFILKNIAKKIRAKRKTLKTTIEVKKDLIAEHESDTRVADLAIMLQDAIDSLYDFRKLWHHQSERDYNTDLWEM